MTSCEIPSLGLPGQVVDAQQELATILDHQQIAPNTYRMRLECSDVAKRILPGQFFMLRSATGSDPLLGRPFALLDIVRNDQGEPFAIDFGYVVVGKFTGLLSTLVTGDELVIWGPLGNGFPETDEGHLAIVAGGIGQTPFVAVIRELLGLERYGLPERPVTRRPRRITFCYGARRADLLAGVEWFELPGVDVRIATDDGSRGHSGFVTGVLSELLKSDDPPTRVYCCGPEPMMKAVAGICVTAKTPAWLSLETPMACGIGACFSCVARIRQSDGEWDYKRVCVEGPVFPAGDVVFEAH